jgi:alpha-beta hydrolase superfamily lysophospholipase
VNATVQQSHTEAKLTIVLVHGAFADGSRWNGVIERLQQHGYTVQARTPRRARQMRHR